MVTQIYSSHRWLLLYDFTIWTFEQYRVIYLTAHTDHNKNSHEPSSPPAPPVRETYITTPVCTHIDNRCEYNGWIRQEPSLTRILENLRRKRIKLFKMTGIVRKLSYYYKTCDCDTLIHILNCRMSRERKNHTEKRRKKYENVLCYVLWTD